jgi:uncharacterized protein (TIGR00730 family)
LWGLELVGHEAGSCDRLRGGILVPDKGEELMIRRLCVFCGAYRGSKSMYVQAAYDTGAMLAERGIALVYGGGNIGLMEVLADAALERGGVVIGVIPESLRVREVAHTGLTELRVVGSMHERKALMADLSDGFLALPGGLGTLEELLEITTWGQLGLHRKPMGLLNVGGYFDLLLAQLDRAVEDGFLRPEHRRLLMVADGVSSVLDALMKAPPPPPARVPERNQR